VQQRVQRQQRRQRRGRARRLVVGGPEMLPELLRGEALDLRADGGRHHQEWASRCAGRMNRAEKNKTDRSSHSWHGTYY
jgi:hypothetical protein